NILWDKYYQAPTPSPDMVRLDDTVRVSRIAVSEFHAVFSDMGLHDAFYHFLQNVYRIYPEDRFHTLIKEACSRSDDDATIYRYIQEKLPTIKPFLSELTYAIPSLVKQKKEMTQQTLQLLGEKRTIDGYIEIGSTGRYLSHLRK